MTRSTDQEVCSTSSRKAHIRKAPLNAVNQLMRNEDREERRHLRTTGNAERRLLERVASLIGLEAAHEWIATPNSHLGGHTPRELLGTTEGRARLDSYVLSLEDGNYL